MTHPSPRPSNQAGPHRPQPSAPPIDPALVYPICRLRDWGFGARGVAALQRAGLQTFRFGRLKFFSGAALIDVLQRGGGGSPDSQSEGEPL